MLEIKNLNITFQKKIFNNISVCFHSSCVHGIVGNSGVGKTTLLKSILDDVNDQHIEIYYNQKRVKDREKFLMNHVAYVDQMGSYFPNMTIKQHFQFYGEMQGIDFSLITIQKFLSKVELKQKNINSYPGVLSIGERKRFLIALALYANKDIILLDEPTASLDEHSIVLLKKIIQGLHNKTMIITTHDQGLLEICDVIHQIDNLQLKCIKDTYLKQEESMITHVKHCFHPTHYFKYKNKRQWVQFIGLIILGIFISFQIMTTINDYYYHSDVDPQVINNSAKEMLHFRNRQGSLELSYVPAIENEKNHYMNQKSLDVIKNISGVHSIQEFGIFTVFNPHNTPDVQSIQIIKKNKGVINNSVEEDGSQAPCIVPYYKENHFDSQNESIFIDEMLSQYLNIQEGDKIKAKFYIPTYQFVNDETSQTYKHVSYRLKDIELTVNKVLSASEGYSLPTSNYKIYIPIEKFKSIITNIDDNDEILSSSRIDTIEKNSKRNLYNMNEYIIFVDEKSIQNVYTSLIEMNDNYDVFSPYLTYLDLAAESDHFIQTKYIILSGICLVGFIAFIVIHYYEIKARKKELALLKINGIDRKAIGHIFDVDNVFYFVLCLLGGILGILLYSLNGHEIINIGLLYLSLIVVGIVMSIIWKCEYYIFLRKEL